MINDYLNDPYLGSSPRATVFHAIRQWIHRGELTYMDVLPTEQQLAERFQVARGTVRLALEELNQEGVITRKGRRRVVAIQPGRLPDQTTAPSLLADTVVVLIEDPVQPIPSLWPGSTWMIEFAVTESVGMNKANCLKVDPHRVKGDKLRELINAQPKGFIAFRDFGMHQAALPVLHEIKTAGLPLVVYGYEDVLKEYDTVTSDQEQGCYLLTRFLIDRGCRRILRYWEKSRKLSNIPGWLKQRNVGYERAMHEAGLEPLEPFECDELPFYPHNQAEFDMRVTYTAGKLTEILNTRGPVDAVMTLSDDYTYYMSAACHIHRLQPNRDIAIVGYDNYWFNTDLKKFYDPVPLCATIDRCNRRVGWEMVNLLMQRADDELEPVPTHSQVEPELMVVE